ncbi:MAG TPA: iron-sulfur cluster carrier protein ApbC [Blastocatellia bacterium]|nr:iron-sulfur cluster carrier protein ApbC [Blastocatellia bacterium]
MAITEQEILDALRKHSDPELDRDVVTLGWLRDLKVDNGNVSFRLVLPVPIFQSKRHFAETLDRAVSALPNVKSVRIDLQADIPPAPTIPGKAAVPGIKHIIAVSSGKGGVGKSTVAVNLAVALAQAGARVGIMDTDVYGPNIPIMMGINEQPMVEDNGKIGPLEAHGVKLMSIGFLNRGDKPVIWRGPMLDAAVNQFLRDVNWGDLDYLIVDMPPGTGDVQLSLAQRAPVSGAVLVTTPQEVSLSDVRKAANMFLDMKIPLLGIVENMSSFICHNCNDEFDLFGHGGGERLANKYQVPLLGQVPITTTIREGGDRGVPIVSSDPGNPSAKALTQAAEKVAFQVLIAPIGREMEV